MPKYYLRVDAVNIGNFVYDTHDISTIRGGSYLLLDGIESLSGEFAEKLNPVTTAASQGLYWFESDEDGQELHREILAYLRRKTGGGATFLVATQEDLPEDFGRVLELLEAKIHRQQWRMPTIAIPQPASTSTECHLDGWRPGVVDYPYDQDARISAATDFRRKEGARFKRHFFSEILGGSGYEGILSTKDLGKLAEDDSKGILNGKIAFIHVDGNNFGRIRREQCKSDQHRKRFDQSFQQAFRKDGFLKSLIEMAKSDADFQTRDDDENLALRLEVLLWGGDEMTLVVPAWQGWRVLRLFYETARDLQFEGLPLSQRAAVIFCHHNAPILLIRQLAEELLGVTKEDILKRLADSSRFKGLDPDAQEQMETQLGDHGLGDALHYLVLESFDLLRGDLRQFLCEYYRGGTYANLMIYAAELEKVLKSVYTIQASISRGKALKLIEAIQRQNRDKIRKITAEINDLLPGIDKQRVETAIATLTKDGARPEGWYLATDLWDYVTEEAIS